MTQTALPQAVIVSGTPGEDLTDYYTTHRQPNDELLVIQTHPNTSKTSSGIYIDDIRTLRYDVRAAKPHVRTVVILRDAATMTAQSQNALLKLIEEPRPGLHFILETYSPDTLLATIRSRCQHVTLAGAQTIQLPEDKAARIRFMAGGVVSEQVKLAHDERYFMLRSKLFELTKRYVGGSTYDRLVVIKQAGNKRDEALQFIDACLVTYSMLMKSQFTPKLRDEAEKLLAAEVAITQNGNIKLQLLRAVL